MLLLWMLRLRLWLQLTLSCTLSLGRLAMLLVGHKHQGSALIWYRGHVMRHNVLVGCSEVVALIASINMA